MADTPTPAQVLLALEALNAARRFIRNGIEFGYIRMPAHDAPDTAHETLPLVERAIAALSAPAAPTADLWTRHGSGETEWWSRGEYTAKKDGSQWVLRCGSAVVGRCEFLQDAMALAAPTVAPAEPALNTLKRIDSPAGKPDLHQWTGTEWVPVGWSVEAMAQRDKALEIVAETMVMPLADAGVTVVDVERFWGAQGWGLELPSRNGRTTAGNCVLCFLKPAAQVQSLIAEKPARAVWWVRMEALALSSKPSGAVFRSDRPSYAQMAATAADQADAFGHDDEEALACFCGD